MDDILDNKPKVKKNSFFSVLTTLSLFNNGYNAFSSASSAIQFRDGEKIDDVLTGLIETIKYFKNLLK